MAENILVGPGNMSVDVIEGVFVRAPPHREHIVSPLYIAIGVGSAVSADRRMWVAVELGG